MESRQAFGFAFDPEYSEEEMARMDAHRCTEEADVCDFNNALIRGCGMLLQGSKVVVAMVANASLPCFLICYRDAHVVANICYCHRFLVLLI